jgi:hypothetical protein
MDSNPRPPHCELQALPSEAQAAPRAPLNPDHVAQAEVLQTRLTRWLVNRTINRVQRRVRPPWWVSLIV